MATEEFFFFFTGIRNAFLVGSQKKTFLVVFLTCSPSAISGELAATFFRNYGTRCGQESQSSTSGLTSTVQSDISCILEGQQPATLPEQWLVIVNHTKSSFLSVFFSQHFFPFSAFLTSLHGRTGSLVILKRSINTKTL